MTAVRQSQQAEKGEPIEPSADNVRSLVSGAVIDNNPRGWWVNLEFDRSQRACNRGLLVAGRSD
jgi:hypothetical protein